MGVVFGNNCGLYLFFNLFLLTLQKLKNNNSEKNENIYLIPIRRVVQKISDFLYI